MCSTEYLQNKMSRLNLSHLHDFLLRVRLEFVLDHLLFSSLLGQVREALDGSVVRDSRLEHVEHAGSID